MAVPKSPKLERKREREREMSWFGSREYMDGVNLISQNPKLRALRSTEQSFTSLDLMCLGMLGLFFDLAQSISVPSGCCEQAQRSCNPTISKSPELWCLTLESVWMMLLKNNSGIEGTWNKIAENGYF